MDQSKHSKQMEIYEFIKEQLKEKGYPPSVREICSAVGLRSTSTVHGHLERLEKKVLSEEIRQNQELLRLWKIISTRRNF